MGNENSKPKRGRGRPAGREFDHVANIPFRKADWERLKKVAAQEGKSSAEIIRGLVDRYLKRR